MTPTTPNPLRRSESSRRAILAAALELCAEYGYRRVTMEAIAARAGVSKKTIYRWWPSRGAVVLDGLAEGAMAASPFPDTGDVAADLRTQMTAVLDFLVRGRYRGAYSLLIAETQDDERLARSLNERLLLPRIAEAAARLRRAQDQGQIAADVDPELAVEMLYGPLYYRLFIRHEGIDAHRTQALIAQTLRGLAP